MKKEKLKTFKLRNVKRSKEVRMARRNGSKEEMKKGDEK